MGSQPSEELGDQHWGGGDGRGKDLEVERNRGCLGNQERAEGLDQGQARRAIY